MSPLTWSVPALLLALVLAVSGVAKVRDPQSTRESFYTLRLPLRLTRSAAPWLLPWGEIALAGALLLTSGWVQALMAIATVVLFAAYLVVIVRASRFPEKVECGCLGKLGLGTVGPVTIVRNALLLALAVATVVDALRHGSVIGRLLATDTAGWGWLLAIAVTVLLTGLMTYASGGSRGQDSTEPDADELADYERRPTPSLWLTDIDGDRHNLLSLSMQQALFVVYANMGCGACMTVIDALPGFKAANPELAVHVLVQVYDEAARSRLPADVPVFVDPDLIFVQFFQLNSPGAVLFGADGMLAGGPTYGSGPVLSLMTDISEALAEAREGAADLTGTEIPQ
ncbi:MAG TPA: MauE/DoxX family redox-associated membrane protein [Dermatophilaceae bacterium]|jgi:hypothetical protein|nr:thioredoxin family protein [Actinomycetales bacterium]HMT33127.1 MauE/DoxX family redox-associated membrane protein [Dermatophilaceae bacterium]HMT88937.1 MauE/DoxX family redox-associated membrane protein [Dermatophilaceae bacterium]